MKSVDFNRIQQLVAKRDAFIENSPPERREKLRSQQQRIDDQLRKAGPKNRLAVIQDMMFASLFELNQELQAFKNEHSKS